MGTHISVDYVPVSYIQDQATVGGSHRFIACSSLPFVRKGCFFQKERVETVQPPPPPPPHRVETVNPG